MLHTLKICKVRDSDGREITPSPEITTGITMCVALFSFSFSFFVGSGGGKGRRAETPRKKRGLERRKDREEGFYTERSY
jgi:hypothetical protein